MPYNSTIISKKKRCVRCGEPSYIFSKGRCKQCATIEDFAKRSAKEDNQDHDLEDLFKILDDVYSKWLRLKDADEQGLVECFTCDNKLHWTLQQCGHLFARINKFMRYDNRATRVQCVECNEHKGGNIPEYRRRLDLESPGIVEILESEVHLTYKYSREEVRGLINEYRIKLKELKR